MPMSAPEEQRRIPAEDALRTPIERRTFVRRAGASGIAGLSLLGAFSRVGAAGATTSRPAPIVVDQVFGVVRELARGGMTILIVEQIATKALQVADRAYVLETGAITAQGRALDLASDPTVQSTYLGG
jgi:hypothetical protein